MGIKLEHADYTNNVEIEVTISIPVKSLAYLEDQAKQYDISLSHLFRMILMKDSKEAVDCKYSNKEKVPCQK